MATATYTYTEPVAGAFPNPSDEIRFLLGDTRPSAPISMSDAELVYLLARAGNNDVYLAASQAARRMGSRYRKSAAKSKSVGNLSLSFDYNAAADGYNLLADELAEGGGDSAPIGAIYSSSPLMFTQGQFDYNAAQTDIDPLDDGVGPYWPW